MRLLVDRQEFSLKLLIGNARSNPTIGPHFSHGLSSHALQNNFAYPSTLFLGERVSL